MHARRRRTRLAWAWWVGARVLLSRTAIAHRRRWQLPCADACAVPALPLLAPAGCVSPTEPAAFPLKPTPTPQTHPPGPQCPRSSVIKITADALRLQITAALGTTDASNEEVLALLARALNARVRHLTLRRGPLARSKTLVVEKMSPEALHRRLQSHLQRQAKQGRARRMK